MKKLLKDNRGGGYLTACVITIAISMILAVVLFYAQCMTIIQTTRADTERVLESFVMKNSIDIYNSIKQGHDFTEEFDENIEYAEKISPYTEHIHVFKWRGQKKFSLNEGIDEWKKFLNCFSGEHCLLLEFMPDNEISTLPREADALRAIIGG